jgi:rhamnose transport system ATP-binding protein
MVALADRAASNQAGAHMAPSAGSNSDQRAAPVGLREATKSFGAVAALRGATFDLRQGEVLALLGENGAGKSTCVKLLAGVLRPTTGTLLLDGQPATISSPQAAAAAGIAVMHQHPGLFPDLSVAENVWMGHMPRAGLGLDAGAMRASTSALLNTLGLDVDPGATLGRLRTSEQQLVEVARALSREARVLIMDEPTAALSSREVERLFAVVDGLRARGVALMFVGHRMDEIFHVANRVAVLRDGLLVGVEAAAELTRDRAIHLMVGRELSGDYPRSGAVPGSAVLEVRGLSRAGEYEDVGFTVRAGEVVGLGGLVGAGRTELARTLFGITQSDRGEMLVGGEPRRFHSAAEAMAAGVAYVSEDRLGQGLVMDASVLANARLTVLDQATSGGFLSDVRARGLAGPHLDRLRLRFAGWEQPVNRLSGGNQQKVVLAKWLATNPRLLILDEPTQGVDVGTKAEVHALIAELASRGLAILLISSEMPELLGVSDRVVVLREGRQVAELSRDEATQEAVLRAATTDRAAEDKSEGATAWPRRCLRLGREAGLIAAMLAVLIPTGIVNPLVFSEVNLRALAMDASLLTLAALAQLLVMLTRNIDLSVAAVIGLSAYGSALVMTANPPGGIATGIVVALLIGVACGLFNGVVTAYGRVPAIVVTLGTMSIFRGLNSLWTGGQQISADMVPPAWLDLTAARVAGVPLMALIALAILLGARLALRRTETGRRLYAVGSNPDGAALIGLASHRLVLGAFAVAGLLAGLTGALWASRYATVDARVASGFELQVIAAAVVGGVALRGGAGTVLGVALGALTLLVIRNGLVLVRVDPLWLQGVYGLVILAAIAIDAGVGRRTLARRAGA